jgi:hypothetical protein
MDHLTKLLLPIGAGYLQPTPEGSASAGFCEIQSRPKKPYLVIDPGDLPATARELRDLFAASGRFFDRGVPVKIVAASDAGPPAAMELTPNKVVLAAHEFCCPVRGAGEEVVRVTLPQRVAQLYLELDGEWGLPPLVGITTAPVLADNGSVRAQEGYDPLSGLWCARVPPLAIPESPTRNEAQSALALVRQAFCTFPFADAPRLHQKDLGIQVIDLDRPPGLDESSFLVGLLTAICRRNLWLAPGLLALDPSLCSIDRPELLLQV